MLPELLQHGSLHGTRSFFHGHHNPNPVYKARELPLGMATDSVVVAPLQGYPHLALPLFPRFITSISPLGS